MTTSRHAFQSISTQEAHYTITGKCLAFDNKTENQILVIYSSGTCFIN